MESRSVTVRNVFFRRIRATVFLLIPIQESGEFPKRLSELIAEVFVG